MVKRISAILLLIALWLTVTSCDQSIKSATFNIQNNSQYRVTEIRLESIPDKNYQDVLESGKKCTLMYAWVENPTWYAWIEFTMNGEKYGSLYSEQFALDTTGRYKLVKQIHKGETVTVNIYDDHWEW